MESTHLLGEGGMTVLNVVGIVGGLMFTAFSLHAESETRRIANLLAITANHREVWKEFFRSPELETVFDAAHDLTKQPITPKEKVFVNMIILHLSSVFEALKDQLLVKQQGLREDVASFFSFPIPKAVWENTKRFQNKDFAAFVDRCREESTR